MSVLCICSPVSGTPFNASLILGGIRRDSVDVIISAGAAMMTYYMKTSNSTEDDIEEVEVIGAEHFNVIIMIVATCSL